jgi:hypothetical protein
MKVIVSHDVDHIAFSEHWLRDLVIPKWFAKNLLYAAMGKLSLSLATRRLAAVLGPYMNHVRELMNLDHRFGVRSTFFIGVSQGLGMSYTLEAAVEMVNLIRDSGFPVGVHAIAHDHGGAIQDEHNRFRKLVADDSPFGVRNHYLRFGPRTPALQARAGYLFDSSEYGLKAPYLVGGIGRVPGLLDGFVSA